MDSAKIPGKRLKIRPQTVDLGPIGVCDSISMSDGRRWTPPGGHLAYVKNLGTSWNFSLTGTGTRIQYAVIDGLRSLIVSNPALGGRRIGRVPARDLGSRVRLRGGVSPP